MKNPEPGSRGDLHASVDEVEKGLFRAEYNRGATDELDPDKPDSRALPDSHVATSLQAAKAWVEALAVQDGYRGVVWDRLPD
ncbi:MAG: hypothetical protein M3Y41_06090 [Pseudomonadota bacterium]|nr:hypothetical protein [Pseudomonadota bacterium]